MGSLYHYFPKTDIFYYLRIIKGFSRVLRLFSGPEKAADAQYTYTFKEWFKDDSSTVSNIIYNAIYTNTLNQYTIDFVDEDGTVLQSDVLDYGATVSAV